MLDEEKKEYRKSAKAFQVKVDLKVELCKIIQEWENGGRVDRSHNRPFYFQTCTFL